MKNYSVQGVIRQHLTELKKTCSFPLYIHKTLDALVSCRTAALGGHAQYCDQGHLNGVWYNSCKHRACPQCRSLPSEEWLNNTKNILLNCPHHHIVFTLPSEFHVFWRFNRSLMTDMLFRASRETLKTFSDNPKYLDATPGILSALHTWGRNLCLHPHLHVLVSHGGLSAEGDWVTPKKKHLFPQKPTMMIFRGKFLALMREALENGQLRLPEDVLPHKVRTMLNFLGRKDWVVYYSERYDHPRGVANYLSRYVKGGPFRNSQINNVDKESLTFQYKSHKTKRIEKMRLPVKAFIHRLLEHVPLPGKPTVRYGGLYVSSNRSRLNIARKACGQGEVVKRAPLDWATYLMGRGMQPECVECGRPLFHREKVASDFKR